MSTIDKMLENVTWTPIEAPPITDGSLYATHTGVLTIEGLTLKCYQLSNGQRVIDGQSMAKLFGFDSVDALSESIAEITQKLSASI